MAAIYPDRRKKGRQSLVWGLRWAEITAIGVEKQEVAILGKEYGAGKVVEYRRKGLLCGFLQGKAPKSGGRLLSAAVLFALKAPPGPAILVKQLQDGRFGLIGVLDRVPCVGFDLVGTEEEAAGQVLEFQRLYGDEIAFYGDRPHEVESDFTPFEFGALLGDKEAVKAATLKSCGQTSLATVILLVFVVFAAIGGFRWYQEQQRIKRQRLAAQAAMVDPVAEYRQAMAAAWQGEYAAPAALSAGAYLPAIGNLEIYRAGWTLTGINCAEGICRRFWNRVVGTNLDFIRAGASADLRLSYPDGKQLEERITVAPVKVEPPSLASLPAGREFLTRTGSFFQEASLAGIAVNLQNPEDFAGIAAPAEVEPAERIYRGVWEISGDYAWAREIMGRLPANMTLAELGVKISAGEGKQEIRFNSRGYFYVRNR